MNTNTKLALTLALSPRRGNPTTQVGSAGRLKDGAEYATLQSQRVFEIVEMQGTGVRLQGIGIDSPEITKL